MRHLVKRMLVWLFSVLRSNEEQKVLYYHDVGTAYTEMGTLEEVFKAHVNVAKKRGYKFIGPDNERNDRTLVLAFDDGYRGIWDMREFFKEQNLFPMVFIAVGLVGQPGYLTWREIRVLQDDYGFVFESHTWSHRSLTEVPLEELSHELKDARNELSTRLGRNIDRLCFPRGKFSSSILDACAESGYCDLYTSIPSTMRNLNEFVRGVDPRIKLFPRILSQRASVGEYIGLIRGGLIPFSRRYFRQHFVSEDLP